MPPVSSAPSFRMMLSVPATPWLSMSLLGLRMISTRSTSSAGMRSTVTVLSFVAPVTRRPLTSTWVYSVPMPRSDGAEYSPMSLEKTTPGTRFIMSPTDSGSKRWKNSSSYDSVGGASSTRLRTLTRFARTSISSSSGVAALPCCAQAALAGRPASPTASVNRTNLASLFIAAPPCIGAVLDAWTCLERSGGILEQILYFHQSMKFSFYRCPDEPASRAGSGPQTWLFGRASRAGYFIVGMTNCALSRRAVGQREVTVLSRV
jgi:hypothetical protein